MRLTLLAVVVLLTGCNPVKDTCDAGDVDCWFDHLEVTAEGLEVERFAGRTLLGSEGIPISVATSRDAKLWAVGMNGEIVVETDEGWLRQDSGTSGTLSSVWVAAINDVWAGGNGELLHFDGVSWKRVTDTLDVVSSISGSSASDVWFATGAGGLIHFDGSGFTTVNTGFTGRLISVWVAAPGDVWAGGPAGALLHVSGGQWTRVQSSTSHDVLAIHGLSPSDVYLAADQLMRGGAGGFTEIRGEFGAAALHANAGQLWATGASGNLVRGSPPNFITDESNGVGNGVYFDGTQAYLAGRSGEIEVQSNDGASLGSAPAGVSDLLAIHGVAQPRVVISRPTITFDFDIDGGLDFEPGEKKDLPLKFEDPCGATPGICVQLCSGTTRCSSGIICTRQKPDSLIKGRVTLGVRYSAAPRGEEEPVEPRFAACSCGGCPQMGDGGVTFGPSKKMEHWLQPIPDTQSAAGGGGGTTGSGGGGGSSSCDHCVTGQRCSACGTELRAATPAVARVRPAPAANAVRRRPPDTGPPPSRSAASRRATPCTARTEAVAPRA